MALLGLLRVSVTVSSPSYAASLTVVIFRFLLVSPGRSSVCRWRRCSRRSAGGAVAGGVVDEVALKRTVTSAGPASSASLKLARCQASVGESSSVRRPLTRWCTEQCVAGRRKQVATGSLVCATTWLDKHYCRPEHGSKNQSLSAPARVAAIQNSCLPH
jgi:hypothetical protein